ncbi:uncharacterized protein BDZ99DRAFT_483178 [Mytilinidion resinicola]|uniref:Uncharacterized protein n=1 Tax=Mytilinidion resinicola TaxID=574789 RepID=A0A6A6Y0T4_9PEZI|nr:uncharacterized protein BDZ99DRAFT_483178 [Mytilinidion resinicola]KAF2802168.1 hypothetical protein BDZ99DRAFT_483178 [Mytilinidion resinicola]
MATASTPVALPSLPVEIFDNILDQLQELIEKDIEKLEGVMRQRKAHSRKRERIMRCEERKRMRMTLYSVRLVCREISTKTRIHFARRYVKGWKLNLNEQAKIQDLFIISKNPDFSATLQRLTVNITYSEEEPVDDFEEGRKPRSESDPFLCREEEHRFFNVKENIVMITEAVSHLKNLDWVGFEHKNFDSSCVRWEKGTWNTENAHILRIVEAFLPPMRKRTNAVSKIHIRLRACYILGLDIKFFNQIRSFQHPFSELRNLTLRLVNLDDASPQTIAGKEVSQEAVDGIKMVIFCVGNGSTGLGLKVVEY